MRRRLLFLAVLVMLWVIPSWGAVSTVRRGCILGWDANTEPDLAGYRLYTARISGGYGAPTLEVGPGVVTATCAQLGFTQGVYYMRVSAFDTADPSNESPLSNELTVDVLVQVRVY